MSPEYTVTIQRDGKWWIGWIEEVRGVMSQGRTKKELLDNLQSALSEALEMDFDSRKSDSSGKE